MTHSTRNFSWWILRIHWLLGIVILAVYTQTPKASLVLVSTAWICGVWMDARETPRERLTRITPFIVVILLAVFIADLFFIRGDLMSCASFMLIGIQSVRMILPKGVRESWQLCALSFLEFLVAASVADEMSFALFAFIFLASSIGSMWSLHNREARELGLPPGGYNPSFRTTAWALILLSAGGFLMTAALFAAVPRLEFRKVLFRSFSKNAISGFSDKITLNEITDIKADRRIVARVEFPSLEEEPAQETLYLRGAVYSRYSDGGWQLAGSSVFPVFRSGFNYYLGEISQSNLTTAYITLEPSAHYRLFTYGEPLQVETSAGPLLSDREGNLFFIQNGHPTLRYRLMFAEKPPTGQMTTYPRRRHLVFPPGNEDIRALALKTTESANTDEERVALLLDFFNKGFRYSLNNPAPTLRSFLFEEKRGYCEHYAAGLALLLRAAGIPSRVAVGYLGGEWNSLGRYIIVRQSNAHAWVEAWMGDRWVTLDATPYPDESFFARKMGVLWLYIDWLGYRWNKYVMNYSLRMQRDAVKAGMSGLRQVSRPKSFEGIRWILLVAAIAFFSGFLWKKRQTREKKIRGSDRLPASYNRLLRRLEKTGYRTSLGIPMAEMLEAAVQNRPGLEQESRAFLLLYHQDRFGARPLPPDIRAKAASLADRLNRQLSV
ncbi:MAG: transglutaminaseTgpA domain-containing protein [Syntrophorhabdaceae bacterium]|nr:transglutaminaseTgpA domain-containing protein [Syntrophorhabdaceae bacterium]